MTSHSRLFAPARPARLRLFDLPGNMGSAFHRLMLRREQLRELSRLQAMPRHLLDDIGLTPQMLAAQHDHIMGTPLWLGKSRPAIPRLSGSPRGGGVA